MNKPATLIVRLHDLGNSQVIVPLAAIGKLMLVAGHGGILLLFALRMAIPRLIDNDALLVLLLPAAILGGLGALVLWYELPDLALRGTPPDPEWPQQDRRRSSQEARDRFMRERDTRMAA